MTQVEQIIKRPGLRLIALSDGETLRVPYGLFRLRPLKAGLPLPEGYLDQLLLQAPKAALEQAGRMLQLRDHSIFEVRRKLQDQAYPEAAIEGVIQRLVNARLLDDHRFAMNLVRRMGRKMGPRRIMMELKQKGIEDGLAQEALASLEEGQDKALALALARKALKKRSADPRRDAQRAFAALARRGFSSQAAREAVDEVMQEELPADDESMYE